jgi:hypothetical protein
MVNVAIEAGLLLRKSNGYSTVVSEEEIIFLSIKFVG